MPLTPSRNGSRAIIVEELSFLEREFGFAPTDVECWDGESCARYRNGNVVFEVRLNYLEGILSTPLIIAASRQGQPDIALELNMIHGS